MTRKPYHEYVYDIEKRKFVGRFEDMYAAEDRDGFDSWCCMDVRAPARRISLALIGQFNFDRILCYGCGKGAFAHLLKQRNNYVMGVDISPTAIKKARQTYGHLVDFQVIEDNDFGPATEEGPYDLTVAVEVLSLVEDWRTVLEQVSTFSRHLFVELWLPEDPIGFVKSFDDLLAVIGTHYRITDKVIYNDDVLSVLAESRSLSDS